MKKLLCVLASVMFIFSGGVHIVEASGRGGNAQLQGETTQTNSKKTTYKRPSKQQQTTKQKQQQKKESKERRAANQAKRDFKKK